MRGRREGGSKGANDVVEVAGGGKRKTETGRGGEEER